MPLLDPKNDFVFKKLFAPAPGFLAALINAVRSDARQSPSSRSSIPTSPPKN